MTQAEAELADAQQREEAQYDLFCKRVREMEEQGTVSYWSVLFKATSFSDLLGRLDFVNEIMDYDQKVIDDLQALQAEIEEKKAGLESSQADLQAAKAELEQQKAQLGTQRDEANRLVKEIDDNAAEYQATLKALEAEERRIEQQVKDLQTKAGRADARRGEELQHQPRRLHLAGGQPVYYLHRGRALLPRRRRLYQPQGHGHRPGGLHQPGVRRKGRHGDCSAAFQFLRKLCGHLPRYG